MLLTPELPPRKRTVLSISLLPFATVKSSKFSVIFKDKVKGAYQLIKRRFISLFHQHIIMAHPSNLLFLSFSFKNNRGYTLFNIASRISLVFDYWFKSYTINVNVKNP